MISLKKLLISKQIVITLSILFIIFICVGLLIYSGIQTSKHKTVFLTNHTIPKLRLINGAEESVGKMQALILRHILTHDTLVMNIVEQSIYNIYNINMENLEQYRDYIVNEEGNKLYNIVLTKRNTYWDLFEQLLKISRQNNDQDAYVFVNIKLNFAYDEYELAMKNLETFDTNEGGNSSRTAEEYIYKLETYSYFLIGLGIIVVIGMGFIITRFTHRLKVDNIILQNEIRQRKIAQAELKHSECKYSTTLSSIGDAVIATDINGTVTFMNEISQLLTGWNESDAIGKNLTEVFNIINEETREIVENPVEKVIQKGIIVGLGNHTVLISKDGKQYPIDDSAAPIKDNKGNITGVVLVFHDITERKQVLELLQKAESKYRALFTNANDSIFLMTEDTFVDCNPKTEKMFGCERKEILNRKPFEFSPTLQPDNRDSREKALEKISEAFSGVPQFFEWKHKRLDGTLFDAEISLNRIEIEGKSMLQAIVRDITERKCVERQLRLMAHSLASTAECVSITDTEDQIIYVNNAFLRTYGYTEAELIGKNIAIFRIINNGQELLKIIRSATFAGGWQGELMNRRKDGTEFPIYLSTTVVRDEYGEIVGLVGIATDITERKRAEEALRESTERFRSLYENATIGIYQTTQDGQILLANPTLVNMLGYSSLEELRQRNLKKEGFEPEYPRSLFQQKIETDGLVRGFESAWTKKDGTIIFVRESAKAIRDKEGKTIYYEGTVEDVTECKQAEKALAASEKKYRNFIENTILGVYKSNLIGDIFYANRALLDILEFESIEEIKSVGIPYLYKNPLDRNRVIEILKGYGKIENFEFEIHTKTRKTKNVILNATLEGDLISGMIKDITDMRMFEQRLFQTQKLESIGTLAGGIAHDFNNILSIILGHSDLLERFKNDPDKISNSVDAIMKATQRGASLVKQLLTFARKTDVLFESVNVNDIIADINKLLQETFPKVIVISTELQHNLPFINADNTQIHQIILNLCVNARDAMLKGGTLFISTSIIDGDSLILKFPEAISRQYVQIEVTDTGMGMDEATRKRIFEPFFTTKDPGKGTGLGLSLVYGIVTNHKGFIDVESEPGKGTTFRIYLPLQEHPLYINKNSEKVPQVIPGGSETILLIEDEEMLRDLVKEVIVSKGYTVITAEDGDKGLDVFRIHQKEIAVVFSDIGLPKLDGNEVFKKIRIMNPKAKVILASGFIDPMVKLELYKAGANYIIQKPYTTIEVLKTIREVIDTNV